MPKIECFRNKNKLSDNTNNALDYYTFGIGIKDDKNGSVIGKFFDGIPTPRYEIKGWITDDSWTEANSSTWSAMTEVGDGVIGNISKLMTAFGFTSLRTKGMFRQIWTGAENPTFNITMFIESEDSSDIRYAERMGRLLQLLTVPEEGNSGSEFANFLKAPGAQYFRFGEGSNDGGASVKIDYVRISKFITLRNVNVIKVTPNFDILNFAIIQDRTASFTTPLTLKVEMEIESRDIWTSDTIINLWERGEDAEKATVMDIDAGKILGDMLDNIKKLTAGLIPGKKS